MTGATVRAGELSKAVPFVAAELLRDGYSLAGQWYFRAGDDLAWADPAYDDSRWQRRNVPAYWPRGGYPEHGQRGWYRLTIKLDRTSPEHLGVQIGKVLSAYELYAGGQLLGGVGKLPPLSEVNYDRQRVYALPLSAIAADGTVVLAMRVWGGEDDAVAAWGAGPFGGVYRVGDYRQLLQSAMIGATPGLLISALFIAFGLYHLYLYRRNRQLGTFLWYSLLALSIGVYALMLNQWKYVLDWPFFVYKKIEFTTLYAMPAISIQMIWSLLGLRIGRGLRLYQACYVLLAVLVAVLPGEAAHYRTLSWWQLSTLPLLVLVPWVVIREARAGNGEAKTLSVGVFIFVVTCVNDLLIDLAHVQTARLVPYGFLAIMLSMAVSLANLFTTMLNRLEQEVAQRTEELSSLNVKLAEVARVDPLTGLLNRRGFIEEVEAEIKRAQRTGRDFSLVMADIDDFKLFNDRHGHICGDFVLCRVAATLSERLRDVDCVARWGGEEFIILLPETDLDGATQLAEQLRQNVARKSIEFEGQRLSITMTFGITNYHRGESLDRNIARADSALYRGKESGRNCVVAQRHDGLTVVA